MNRLSRLRYPPVDAFNQPPVWSFLTNHAEVLLCIAKDPGIRLREIGVRVGVTERAAHRIVDVAILTPRESR